MKQGFRMFRISPKFEEEVEEFCKTYYIKKWEILKSTNISNQEIVLVEYRDRFLSDAELEAQQTFQKVDEK